MADGTEAQWWRRRFGVRGDGLSRIFGRGRIWAVRGEQGAAEGEVASAVTIGQQAVVPNAREAVRKDVEEEAAKELRRVESHDLLVIGVAIVLPPEGDRTVVEGEDAAIGEGDAVGVAAEVGQYVLGSDGRGLA